MVICNVCAKTQEDKYDVVFMDREGDVKQNLVGTFPLGISKKKLKEPPGIEIAR